MTHTLFISDLHLDAAYPQQVRWFTELLQKEQGSADAIYILGDLFEYWIGDDDSTSMNQQLIDAMHQCAVNDTALFIMHGNRDFLLGSKFCQRTGARLLPDPCLIEIYDKKILLTHGDQFCTLDKAYQRYRKIIHNVILQSVFLWLPLFVRRWIASKLRSNSKQHNQQKDTALMDVEPKTVTAWLQRYQPDLLIYGHVHKPEMKKINDTDVVVLGDWHDAPSVLTLKSDGALVFDDLRVTN